MVRPSIGRAERKPSLLIVGAATRDIAPAEPRGWRLGGGVCYGAMAAARLGASVRALIGVDDDAAAAWELADLQAAGVDVQLVRMERGPVMENRDTGAGRVQLVGQASDPVPVEALPSAWRGADAVLLCPVAGELDAAWSGTFAEQALVGLAWQGLLRRLVPGRPVERLPLRAGALVTRADVALVSADDVGNDAPVLSRLLSRNGQQLVVTDGARGALHGQRTRSGLRWRLVPALPAPNPVDATGAGDVFLAAWFAALVGMREAGLPEPWRPLAVAAAAASLSVRGHGLGQLPDLRGVCRLLTTAPGSVQAPPG